LIIDQHIFLEEGKLGGKHQAQLLKGKGKMDSRNRVEIDASTQKITHNDQGPQIRPQHSHKKKTCWYCGNTGHVENKLFKKRENLEEKVKILEGDVSTIHRLTENFTF
jgi:hypothetical protein